MRKCDLKIRSTVPGSARMYVSSVLGKSKATAIFNDLKAKRSVLVRKRRCSWSGAGRVTVEDPALYLIEARNWHYGGMRSVPVVPHEHGWADEDEFLWTALSFLVMDNPYPFTNRQKCISLWKDKRMPSLWRTNV